ncbi:hypothetical protein NQ317_015803 [Molorchus minor]|uniref:Uncharacterized protein n=1 Tax=Molorchus minor TaxID=1323400 RepID=A0ABQ9IRY7_9CUCU|nr:hypothetical protein NQ317_015803 [Molorchus minor]
MKAKPGCNDCKPEKLVKVMTLTECELRKIERCMRTIKNQQVCQYLGVSCATSKKTYPIRHAPEKRCLPGCPAPGWQKLIYFPKTMNFNRYRKISRSILGAQARIRSIKRNKTKQSCDDEDCCGNILEKCKPNITIERTCHPCSYFDWKPKLPDLKCLAQPKPIPKYSKKKCRAGMIVTKPKTIDEIKKEAAACYKECGVKPVCPIKPKTLTLYTIVVILTNYIHRLAVPNARIMKSIGTKHPPECINAHWILKSRVFRQRTVKIPFDFIIGRGVLEQGFINESTTSDEGV